MGEICLFFGTINLDINDFIEIQHSQNNKIGDEGAKNMAEALSINNTLTTLHLAVRFVYFLEQSILKIDDFIEIQHSQDNKIGVEGAKNMAEALAINNTLTTLDLRVGFVYFLKQSILKLTILLKFNIHRPIKLELKEQITWQKHWQSTTH